MSNYPAHLEEFAMHGYYHGLTIKVNGNGDSYDTFKYPDFPVTWIAEDNGRKIAEAESLPALGQEMTRYLREMHDFNDGPYA